VPFDPVDLSEFGYYVALDGSYYVSEDNVDFYIWEDLEPPPTVGGTSKREKYKPPKKIKLDSTNIANISFDNRTQQLNVKFKEGRTYKFFNVAEKHVNAIQKAKSAGAYFHQQIKGKYIFQRPNAY